MVTMLVLLTGTPGKAGADGSVTLQVGSNKGDTISFTGQFSNVLKHWYQR